MVSNERFSESLPGVWLEFGKQAGAFSVKAARTLGADALQSLGTAAQSGLRWTADVVARPFHTDATALREAVLRGEPEQCIGEMDRALRKGDLGLAQWAGSQAMASLSRAHESGLFDGRTISGLAAHAAHATTQVERVLPDDGSSIQLPKALEHMETTDAACDTIIWDGAGEGATTATTMDVIPPLPCSDE